MMPKSTLQSILSALFILLFVYTGIGKLLDHRFFEATLSKSPLIGSASTIFSYVLPVVELGIAALLFVHQRIRVGWYATFALMLMFTGYIAYMLLSQSKLPCSCGGVLKGLTWGEHLLFNVAFTILAFAGLWLSRHQNAPITKARFGTIV
jgi:hypothetical protein